MEDNRESPFHASKSSDSPTPMLAATRRRAPARKTAAARKKTSRPAPTRKSAAVKKPAARKASPQPHEGLEAMLASFSKTVERAGASVSSVSADSVRAARRAWNRAGVASKSTVRRVMKEWKEINPKRRASYVAALVGALAAASAPIVRAQMKKR